MLETHVALGMFNCTSGGTDSFKYLKQLLFFFTFFYQINSVWSNVGSQ